MKNEKAITVYIVYRYDERDTAPAGSMSAVFRTRAAAEKHVLTCNDFYKGKYFFNYIKALLEH